MNWCLGADTLQQFYQHHHHHHRLNHCNRHLHQGHHQHGQHHHHKSKKRLFTVEMHGYYPHCNHHHRNHHHPHEKRWFHGKGVLQRYSAANSRSLSKSIFWSRGISDNYFCQTPEIEKKTLISSVCQWLKMHKTVEEKSGSRFIQLNK